MAAKMAQKATEPEEEQISESYISIGLGILVVIVVGILLYNYFTQKGANKTQTQNEQSDKLAQEATMSAKPGTTYTVIAGDTLWSISEKSYGTGFDWKKIADANHLTTTSNLEAGQKLEIPEVATATPEASAESSSVAMATAVPTSAPELSSPVPTATPVASPATVSSTTTEPKITGVSYTVVAGDTLWDIACRAYGDCYAWTKIATANKLVNPDLIHSGNVFTLPR